MAEEFSLTKMLQETKENPTKLAIPLVTIACIGGLVWWKLCMPKRVLIEKQLKANKGLVGSLKSFKNAATDIHFQRIHTYMHIYLY